MANMTYYRVLKAIIDGGTLDNRLADESSHRLYNAVGDQIGRVRAATVNQMFALDLLDRVHLTAPITITNKGVIFVSGA